MIAQAAKGNDRNFIFISFPARLRPLHRRLQTVRQSGPEVYLTDIMDLPEFMDVWNSHFNESPCALTVVATKGLALLESKIEINIFGVRDSGKIKKQIIDHKASVAMRLGPAAVRAGDLLCLSALYAADEEDYAGGAGVRFVALSRRTCATPDARDPWRG